ncbi:hypothetical protein L345_12815, partial [Ophiophagus hannah]
MTQLGYIISARREGGGCAGRQGGRRKMRRTMGRKKRRRQEEETGGGGGKQWGPWCSLILVVPQHIFRQKKLGKLDNLAAHAWLRASLELRVKSRNNREADIRTNPSSKHTLR